MVKLTEIGIINLCLANRLSGGHHKFSSDEYCTETEGTVFAV